MDEHFEKGLVTDSFSFGDLTRLSKIGRGETECDLHAARTLQGGDER